MENIFLLNNHNNDTKVIHLCRLFFPPLLAVMEKEVSAESQNKAAEIHGL